VWSRERFLAGGESTSRDGGHDDLPVVLKVRRGEAQRTAFVGDGGQDQVSVSPGFREGEFQGGGAVAAGSRRHKHWVAAELGRTSPRRRR
jgi:hypothetical protein